MFINIMDYGAKGDGKSDDTKALLAAIAKAQVEDGTVFFPAGHYRIHPIKLPSHITLFGNSSWGYSNRGGRDEGYMGRVVISPLSAEAIALFDLTGEKGTRIIGLTLDGLKMGEGMHGVYTHNNEGEQNLCIEDCVIANFTGSGIRMDTVWVFAVRRCLIKGNMQHGIDCTYGFDGWIIDNQMSGNRGAGLFAGTREEVQNEGSFVHERPYGMATVMVTANRIEWNRIGGIVISNSNTMQVTGCSMDHNFGPGVSIKHSVANTISGCQLRSNGADRLDDMSCQIYLENCKGTAVTGNSLWGWFGRTEHEFVAPTPFYGIIVKDLVGCNVAQNSMYECSSKEGIVDKGGHEATYIGENMYTKPKI